jgi:signal transduction histidine kinase
VKHHISIYEEWDPISKMFDKFLKIKVIDSGIGIDKKDQKHLFKLFGFVKSSLSMNRNGIGLGLVIIDKIVKKFNGEIGFESFPTEGTTFTFSFKLEDAHESNENED